MTNMEDDVFRDMEHANVIDSKGVNLGKIDDFTHEDFTLKHFVIKGDNPDLREHFKIRSSYMLLLPPQIIRRISAKGEVIIKEVGESLQLIQAIGVNEKSFKIMRDVDVIAADGENLGNIIDGIFHKDNQFSLILGGSRFDKFLANFGVQGKSNLLIPPRFVERFDSTIILLNKNRDDLGSAIQEILMDTDSVRLLEQQKLASHEARMELYNEALLDVIRGRYNTTPS